MVVQLLLQCTFIYIINDDSTTQSWSSPSSAVSLLRQLTTFLLWLSLTGSHECLSNRT